MKLVPLLLLPTLALASPYWFEWGFDFSAGVLPAGHQVIDFVESGPVDPDTDTILFLTTGSGTGLAFYEAAADPGLPRLDMPLSSCPDPNQLTLAITTSVLPDRDFGSLTLLVLSQEREALEFHVEDPGAFTAEISVGHWQWGSIFGNDVRLDSIEISGFCGVGVGNESISWSRLKGGYR